MWRRSWRREKTSTWFYKNLTRKKMRLFLTCFAIFIAFLIFGAVTALQGALNSGIEMSADNRLVVVHKPISLCRCLTHT